MSCRPFGKIEGSEVYEYTVKNERIQLSVTNFGATITALKVKDVYGRWVDVALGLKSAEEYNERTDHIGATVGRVSGRIGGASFSLNGKNYSVSQSDGGGRSSCLHGGFKGLHKRVWSAREWCDCVEMSYLSDDGEEGFPAEVVFRAIFTIDDKGLEIEYIALPSEDTPISMTNHTYFNLDGEGSGDVGKTYLKVESDFITPVDQSLVATGEIRDVIISAFDFRKWRFFAESWNERHIYDQIVYGKGYDVNFIIKGSGMREMATAVSKKSGIKMKVFSDAPCMHLYTANHFDGSCVGKSGKPYERRSGFCLETQRYPNAVNIPSFPSSIVKKDEKYTVKTRYEFSAKSSYQTAEYY